MLTLGCASLLVQEPVLSPRVIGSVSRNNKLSITIIPVKKCIVIYASGALINGFKPRQDQTKDLVFAAAPLSTHL